MSWVGPLSPWAESPPGGDAGLGAEAGPANQAELRAAQLFRQVQVPVRFQARPLGGRGLATGARRWAGRRLSWVVAVLLVTGGGAVLAATGVGPLGRWWRSHAEGRLPQRSAGATVKLVAAPPAPALAGADPQPASPPAAGPGPAAREDRRSRRTAPGHRRAPAALAPSDSSEQSALARETRMLARAFAELHRRADASAALAALDAYSAAFPTGQLRREADSVRVEALLKLGLRRQALALLQSFRFGKGARDTELRVLRGELEAAWDCPQAIQDFEAALRSGAAPALAERAIRGRAACLSRLGASPADRAGGAAP